MSKIVYGISPDVNSGKFIVQEAEVTEMEYYRLKPTGAIFESKEKAEKELKKFVKAYKRR